MKEITSSRLIVLFSVFLITFGNITFFSKVTEIYLVNQHNIAFLISLVVFSTCLIIFLFSLVCYKHTIKPVLITILLISSSTGYFMDSYNVIIDDAMIQNIVNTDMAESMDLLSFKLVLYLVLLGIVPSIYIYRVKIVYAGIRKEVVSRIKLVLLSITLIASVVFIFGDFYASFFREHKPLRYYSNPAYYLHSTVKYFSRYINIDVLPFEVIGLDAAISPEDIKRELIVLVIGETARADRFSLNGYDRETNPFLKKEELVNFTNFWSCGTTTSISVPCMFSIYNESGYSEKKGLAIENLFDVLQHAGVNVLWLDNNSDSKGVAVRAQYESYKSPKTNPVCDPECRDIGMLPDVQKYIEAHPTGDIFIVLHQMGNHGPAYYKRYPPEFEKFKPVCRTNQLEECTKPEIDNAYDNAILYTDYFLSEVIKLLKSNKSKFESVMFYVSDHGESLGENGLYLHGMPNFMAPDEQRHVPAIMWFGEGFDGANINLLKNKRNKRYSHDNIFHTVLGFMEIETTIYNQEMDIAHSVK